MSLSTNRGCFITVMSLALAAHGQTQPPASTGLANNPSFGYKVGGGAFRVGGGVSAPYRFSRPIPNIRRKPARPNFKALAFYGSSWVRMADLATSASLALPWAT